MCLVGRVVGRMVERRCSGGTVHHQASGQGLARTPRFFIAKMIANIDVSIGLYIAATVESTLAQGPAMASNKGKLALGQGTSRTRYTRHLEAGY